MKTKKRFLSILLSLALVLGLMPGMSLTAYADSDGAINIGDSDASGTHWTYVSSTGTLTLNGYNYSGNGSGVFYSGSGQLTILVEGDNSIDSKGSNIGIRFSDGNRKLMLSGTGSLKITSENECAIYTQGDMEFAGGTIEVSGTVGIYNHDHNVTISGGKVTAIGNNGGGIYTKNGGKLFVTGGELVAIGTNGGIKQDNSPKGVVNSIAGIGWTDATGTDGKADIAISTDGQTLDYKKVQFPAYTVTYKVVNGTWSDDSTEDKTETVASGSKPASVPTGMKAGSGYTGGAWDTNPTGATITEARTFTYTFTAKSNQEAPTGLTATKASSDTAADGKISGVTDAMEYQKDGDTAWTAVGENKTEITGLTVGTYKVRYAETEDKNASPETSVVVGVKIAPTVTAPTAKNLTYTGSAQELVTAGTAEGGTMQYALGENATTAPADNLFTTSIPTATNAGTYYVWYKVTGDKDHQDVEAECVTATIKKADYSVTAPKEKDLTYTGSAQKLVTAGEAKGGKMQYALGKNATTAPKDGWGTAIPEGKDAGTYYVWYKVEGDKNHNDTKPAAVKATIAPKSIIGATVTLDKTQLTWNGSEQSVSLTGVTIDGMKLTADDYTVSGNTGKDKGDYTLTVTGEGNFCGTATVAWQIVEKAMTVTAENISVVYDGQPHGITVTVTEPATGAVVKYGATEGTYDLDASPTITEAGTLTVFFKVTAEGYTDYTGSATVTITKDEPSPEPSPEPEPAPAPSGRVLPLLEPTKEDNALKLSWTQMKNVEGYDVFLTKCFTNFSSTPYATISADKSKYEFKGLKKQTMYKAYVRAYVTENGVKKYVSERIDVHCITGGGTDEYTIPAKVRGKDLIIAAGKTKKIEATVIGKNEKKKVLNHNDGKLRYISLNPSVATVSEDGTVKALKEGSAKILVMACNGVRTTVKVTVGKKAEKLSFVKKKYTVREGKTINLYKLLNIDPKNAVVDLKWKSGSKKTATVDENGVVTGVKKGTVTITVKDAVSGLEATVKIQVKKAKKK